MLYRAILGQSAVSQAFFADANNQALVGTGPATFQVRDHNQLLVISTTAAVQDGTNPSLWRATFTLPLSATVPTNPTSRYQINWSMPLTTGATAYATEAFDVIAPGDPIFQTRRVDVLHVVGSDVNDALLLTAQPVSLPIYEILDLTGQVVAGGVAATGPTFTDGGFVMYQVRIPVPRLPLQSFHGFQPYLCRWTYTPTAGTPTYNYHPLYAIDAYIMSQIIRLRSQVDRARMGRSSPDLDWSDADLAIYLMRGLDWLNGVGYIFTEFSLASVPHFALDLLIDAATDKAFKAQGVAETYHTFDMQGSAVQLNTESIVQNLDSIRQSIAGDLAERGVQFKKSMAQGGYSLMGAAPGTMGVAPSARVSATLALRLNQTPASNIMAYEGWRTSYGWFSGGMVPFGGAFF